jgi:hypothetical protein
MRHPFKAKNVAGGYVGQYMKTTMAAAIDAMAQP